MAKRPIYFISCDYREYKPETYNGIEVYGDDNEFLEKVNTGDFDNDYNSIIAKYSPIADILHSSTIDSFKYDRKVK